MNDDDSLILICPKFYLCFCLILSFKKISKQGKMVKKKNLSKYVTYVTFSVDDCHRILNYESRPQRSATSCSNVSVVASNGIDLHLLFEQMECYATHSVGEYFFSLRLFIALAMEKMPVILQARELPRDCNMGIYFKKGAINF